MRTETITPKVAVNCALFDDRGRVLLVQRKDNDLWCLPGGMMELGEQVRDAILREVKEETGLTVEIVRLTGVYSHPSDSLYIHRGPQYQLVILVFLGRILGGEFVENAETYGYRFFDVNDLPPLVESHRQRIQDVLANAADVFIR